MKVAAYQAPFLPLASTEPIPLIRRRIAECEALGVSFLCCPEAILGGLADYAADPMRLALSLEDGTLERTLAPLASSSVTAIVGFSEVVAGLLYNSAAVFHRGALTGVYRKRHPAIRHSVYHAGDQLPVFRIDGFVFGILICNDSNFREDARALSVKGAEVLFVLTNNGLPSEKADVVDHTRAVDVQLARGNGIALVRADVAGMADGRVAFGTSEIVSETGEVLQSARAFREELIVADLTPRAKSVGPGDRKPV